MSYLIDTNVLLRLAQPNHPMYNTAMNAIASLRQNQTPMSILPQNLIEFWAVATRPLSVNGLGMTLAQTSQELVRIKTFFALKPDTPGVFTEWENLVIKYQVMGKQAHDTRIVAAMIVHQMTHLLTFNTDDFKRFSEIAAIDPGSISPQYQP